MASDGVTARGSESANSPDLRESAHQTARLMPVVTGMRLAAHSPRATSGYTDDCFLIQQTEPAHAVRTSRADAVADPARGAAHRRLLAGAPRARGDRTSCRVPGCAVRERLVQCVDRHGVCARWPALRGVSDRAAARHQEWNAPAHSVRQLARELLRRTWPSGCRLRSELRHQPVRVRVLHRHYAIHPQSHQPLQGQRGCRRHD